MRRSNLIAERVRRGWRQRDLGLAVGVSTQTVSNWETGRTKPDSDKAIALETALDVPIEELLELFDGDDGEE